MHEEGTWPRGLGSEGPVAEGLRIASRKAGSIQGKGQKVAVGEVAICYFYHVDEEPVLPLIQTGVGKEGSEEGNKGLDGMLSAEELMKRLKSNKEKEELATMVPVAEGIQPISSKIAQKVDRGEFIEFADLLQDQFPQDELSLPPELSGAVVVHTIESLKKRKKKIVDFQVWAEALMVYVAIKCRSSNPDIANLMAYGVIINQSACENGTDRWLSYDRKFREVAGV